MTSQRLEAKSCVGSKNWELVSKLCEVEMAGVSTLRSEARPLIE